MKKLPYAIANFLTIREENYVYIDRTSYIRTLEGLSGRSLLFVRPRRFGKSLWLNVLSRYYDAALADRFEELFGDLEIGQNPTPLHNRYFVLNWNFSRIDPRGTVDEIADRMNETLNSMIEEFLVYYEFANEVMASDEETYKKLVQKKGPLKTLYKGLKEFTETSVLDRLFITGVSPVVMSDITSGANIFTNIYLDAGFNTLCGFTEQDVRRMLDAAVHTCKLEASAVDVAMQMMETGTMAFCFHKTVRSVCIIRRWCCIFLIILAVTVPIPAKCWIVISPQTKANSSIWAR